MTTPTIIRRWRDEHDCDSIDAFCGSPPDGWNIPIYAKEAKYKFLKLLRIPMYTASVLLFPLMFYILFGLAFGKQQIDGVRQSAYLLATYGTFGVMGASLFGTGSAMAARARPRMDTGKASEPDAAVRLLCSENCRQYRI